MGYEKIQVIKSWTTDQLTVKIRFYGKIASKIRKSGTARQRAVLFFYRGA